MATNIVPGRIFVFFGTQGSNRKMLARTVQTRTGARNLVKFSSRPPRNDDVNGMDNHFVTEAEFARLEADGDFLDAITSDEGYRFGIRHADVKLMLDTSQVAFVTAPAPLDHLKQTYPDQVTRIFVHGDREAYRLRLQKNGESRHAITTLLKNFDQRTHYGRTCEHSVLHENFAQAFSSILAIVREYWPADPSAKGWPG